MRFLNLCSGTGSVSKPFGKAGYDVVEVDWDNRFGPKHCVGIMTWECPYPVGHFDVIWASPDCTQYNKARTTAKTPRNLEMADGLVKRCLELIRDLQPHAWLTSINVYHHRRQQRDDILATVPMSSTLKPSPPVLMTPHSILGHLL